MNVASEMSEASPRNESCTVLVLYEDVATRRRGLAACDYLVKSFWAEVEFDFHWWRTDFLVDASLAAAAAEKASKANLIFLCSTATREPSTALKIWFDSWIENRHEREGMLANLITGDVPAQHPHAGELFLRDISRRANLDYLGTFPQTSTGTFPSSIMDAERSAAEVSALAEGLPRPSHFGINE